jgi:hypothetical protein
MLSTSSYELNGILIEYYEQYARIYKNTTCIIRMSKRPTNTVTDTRRSKTVLNKSADVLHHLASVTTIKITSNTPLKYNSESNMEKKLYTYPEYQGTMSKNSGFICFFFTFSYSLTDSG